MTDHEERFAEDSPSCGTAPVCPWPDSPFSSDATYALVAGGDDDPVREYLIDYDDHNDWTLYVLDDRFLAWNLYEAVDDAVDSP